MDPSSNCPRSLDHDSPLTSPRLRLADSRRLRVLIADRSRLVAEALMFTLDSDPTLEPIGYSLDARNALEVVVSYKPDALIVGHDLVGASQLKFCESVRVLLPRALLITLHDRLVPREIEALYAAGASACVPHSCSADELLHEIAAAHRRRAAGERAGRCLTSPPARRLVGGEALGAY